MREQTLRVAHLTPAFFSPNSVVGGGERYVYYLAHALAQAAAKSGESVEQGVITIGSEPHSFVQDGLAIQVLRNDGPFQSAMEGLSERIWQELACYDLVHVHQSLTLFGIFATVVAKSLGKKAVLTDLGGGENALMLQGHGLQLADGVVSISRYAHSLVEAHYSGPHDILIGPVNTDYFSPPPVADRRERSAICVSRIMRHKGIDRVISALPAGLKLRVVGRVYDAHYYELLLDMARTRDVEFIHDADDDSLLELYRMSGVFIQASTTKDLYGNLVKKPELMGLTTLEAMSTGLPAIVSNAGSLPELVPDERFGRVFHSEAELEDMLRDYLIGAWPPGGATAAQLARAHVVENHSFDVIGRRLLAFYRCVCAA